MATEAATPPAPTAQVVGNAFVEQYYFILHKSPELMHRFYQNSSVLSRPDPNGLATTVTTIKGIHDKFCSFDYNKYTAEIKTADAQDSHKDGVIVLVTGSLSEPENIRKNFTQTFFLAPQDKGYFVLNDVFRYVEDSIVPLENSKVTTHETHDSGFALPTPEPAQVVGSPVMNSSTPHIDEVQNVDHKVHDLVANERDAVITPEAQITKNHIPEVTEIATPIAQKDAPKKSYASILSSETKKGVLGAAKAYVPMNDAKVIPKKVEKKAVTTVARVKNLAPIVESKKNQEAEGHSIYVRNLPLNAMASLVEEEFKKFGPIKQGGVQVRNSKQQGWRFGFVEFQNLNSVNDAIQASPVTIGGWKTIVEIKRTTNRAGGEGGRFSSGRGRFHKRENYVNGRGYGRNEFTNRGDFLGRGKGGSNHIAHST